MRNLYFWIIFFVSPGLVMGQQKAQYSQYMFNNYLLNPAIAGIEDYADIKLGTRKQWVGIEGAPLSFYLSAHTRIGVGNPHNPAIKANSNPALRNTQGQVNKMHSKPRHGIGAVVLHDKIGPFSRSEANFSYAYHLPLATELNLAAGVSAGLIQQSFRSDKLNFSDPTDNAGTGWSVLKPNLASGLWLYSPHFYLGASGMQLLGNQIHFDNTLEEHNTLYNHYFITAAYKIPVSQDVNVIPSIMAKWMKPVPGALDFNLRMQYQNWVWGGVSYRQNDSFAFISGLSINPTFEVGYSYDMGISSLGKLSNGSHEVIVGVRLSNSRKVLCPQNMW